MRYIALISILILSACVTPLDAAKKAHSTISGRGAEASDAFLQGNIDELCNWTTIGALEREFGDNPTMYAAYRDLCGHKLAVSR